MKVKITMTQFDANDSSKKIIHCIAQQLKLDPASINDASTFQDLGADSLDMVQIIMQLEEIFGIEIRDEDAEKMVNVGDVVSYIHERRTK